MWRISRVMASLSKGGGGHHIQRISMSQRSNEDDLPKLPILTLYTKDNCQLCDEAKDALTPLSHRLEEVDITAPSNKEWLKYRYDIPVFHFNGKYLMKHRVNLKEFELTLIEYENIHGRC